MLVARPSSAAVAAYSAAPCATSVIGSWPSATGASSRAATRARTIGITVGPPTSTSFASRPGPRPLVCIRRKQTSTARSTSGAHKDSTVWRVSSRSTSTSWPSIDNGCASVTCARSPRDSSIFASSAARRSVRRACAVRRVRARCAAGPPTAATRQLGDRPVEVATAEEVVAVVTDHAQQPIAGLEQRDIERAAAEVEHQPRRRPGPRRQPAASAEAIGSCRSSTRSNPASRAASLVAALCGSSNSAGTQITARAISTPRWSVMSARSAFRISADSASGERDTPAAGNSIARPVPINRLNSVAVLAGSCSSMRRARAPTVTRPCLSSRTTEGVTAPPWALRITVTWSPSKIAAAELLVPRSKPAYMGESAIAPSVPDHRRRASAGRGRLGAGA